MENTTRYFKLITTKTKGRYQQNIYRRGEITMEINNNKYLKRLTVIPAEIANEKGFIVETNNLKMNIFEFEKFKWDAN